MAEKGYEYDPVSTNAALNPPQYKHEKGQLWRQFIIAGVLNIAVSSTGFILGWTSPIGPKLKDHTPDSPLTHPVTEEELAWVGSLLTIGAMFGPFLAGILVATVGRKWAQMSATAPMFLGWLLVLFAKSLWMLYAARIALGLGCGMIYTITPMYCAEIATDDKRGALGSFLQLFVTFGFLLVYVVGGYSTYTVTAITGLTLLVAFDGFFFFMPETPFFHLSKDDREKATDCLCKIRGRSRAGVQSELDKMSLDVAASLSRKATYSDLLERGNLKALVIASSLILFQQLVGINAVLFNMNEIFRVSGTGLGTEIATIVVGIVQMCSSAITPFVADKLGRRILLIFSGVCMCIGQVMLGAFFYLQSIHSPLAETLSVVPLMSLMIFIIAFCVGIGPLAFAILGELFAMEIKAMASSIGTTFTWISCFLVTRYFSSIASAFGMHVAFWIFGVLCAMMTVFTYFFVPETKGKSFQEIQSMLRAK